MNRALALAVLSAFSSYVSAADESGLLLGVGVGQATYEVDALDFEDDATSWKAFAGWRINDNFSIEAAYIDGGSVSASVGSVSARAEGEIIQGSVVGGYWFTDTFGAYARASYNAYEVELRASGPGGSLVAKDDGNEAGWGAGLQALWDRAMWRLEYESAEFPEVDASVISLSIVWRL